MRRLLPVVLAILAVAAWACSSDDPHQPEPADEFPALFFSPAAACAHGGAGSDTLVVLNQGDAELVWTPAQVPAWVSGLGAEVRLDPGEAKALPWSWTSSPPAPFTDSVVVVTNDPVLPRVRILLESRDPAPRAKAPPPPLLGLPADSARFAVGDTILLAWQEVGGCDPAAYRVQIALDAEFRQVVCCDGFLPATAAEIIVEPGDRGQAWWRIVPRWVGGIVGPPGASRTWYVE